MSVTRRTVTFLFADVVESTAPGERLDPERVRLVMTRYFDLSRDVLERYGGTVEKFVGDAVMAVFGVPELHEDDAVRAVCAAADLREALGRLNDELDTRFRVRLGVRIGINTGEVVAGDPADGGTFATGDAVNVAKRLEPAAIPGVPAISRRFDLPLAGRSAELARLREAHARAVEQRVCVLFTLRGAAGIGKSRLARELFELLRDEATVLVGRCLPYGEGITFWPLNEALRELGGDTAVAELLEDGDERELVLARLAGLSGRAPASDTGETFWAVRRVCESVAQRQPLVLCFEDIHWAEPTLLDLIEYLAGWVRDAPVLLLCLARPESLADRPAFVGAAAPPHSLELEPLSPADAAAMVDALGIVETGGGAERERIVEAAEGNPLFVEQLAALVAETGRLDSVPPTLQALLAARLDRLSTAERGAIERASVAGRQFWSEAGIEMTAEPEHDAVSAALFSLVRKDLIRPARSSSRSGDAFRFGHALIRDAAYAGIPKERRAQLHELFADWLGAVSGARATEFEEILGYHLEQAYRYRMELGRLDDDTRGVGERAGELLGDAGGRAFARGDTPAAVDLLARAAAVLPDDHPMRLEVLPELGSALMRTGDFSRADDVLGEAVERAASAGDKRLELRALIERGFFRSFTEPGDSTDEIIHVAEAAIPLLEQLGDHLGLAKAWWLRSEADVTAGRWAARAEALERALHHSRLSGDGRDEPTLISLLAQALTYGPTPVPEAIRRCEELRQEARGPVPESVEELRDRASAERGVEAALGTTLAELHAMQGEFAEARALCARARALYDDLGLRYKRASTSFSPAAVELLAGEPEAAIEELRWSYDTLEAMRARGVCSTVAAFLAQALVAAGRYEEAEELSVVSEETAAAADVVTQVVWRAARAAALARRGEAAEAESLAREAVTEARTTDFLDLQGTALLALADVLQVTGSAGAASAAIEAARATYERKGNVVAAGKAEALLAGLAA